MRSAASRERWDGGSIPGQAQWVKDPVSQQLWLKLQLGIGSDHWPGNYICHVVAKKEKKKKSVFSESSGYLQGLEVGSERVA